MENYARGLVGNLIRTTTMTARRIILILLVFYRLDDAWAFDYKFEERMLGGGQYYFNSPQGFDSYGRGVDLRAGVLGNAWKKDEWKLDYEVTGEMTYLAGPNVQSGINKGYDADFFRAWFRVDNDQFKLRGGRQKILFGSGTLFRPLGFFDTRDVTAVLPETKGVDGVQSSWFFDETSFVEGWTIPAKKGSGVIVGLRGERLISGWESGMVFQYHPQTSQTEMPNFNLDLTQVGFHVKGERVVGLWNESRLDIQQNGSEKPLRFDTVLGMDYTFALGAGLHVLGEYFLSTRDKQFTQINLLNQPVNLLNQRTIHQLGFAMDQPVGIAIVWRIFGFYDIRDGSFQIAPQIEYALTKQIFLYLYGRWGDNVNGIDVPGRLFLKAPVFTGTESTAGVTVVAYF